MLPERPPEGPLRVMSAFAITSHQYTITFYTPGHLQISWDVFAKKSAFASHSLLSLPRSTVFHRSWNGSKGSIWCRLMLVSFVELWEAGLTIFSTLSLMLESDATIFFKNTSNLTQIQFQFQIQILPPFSKLFSRHLIWWLH